MSPVPALAQAQMLSVFASALHASHGVAELCKCMSEESLKIKLSA